MTTALDTTETERLCELESVIAVGLETFVEVGSALLEIREGRLYREHFDTFDAYCHERWGFTKSRANQLIGAARVLANPEIASRPVKPDSEGQVRPLAKLPPEDQTAAWDRAVETAPGGRPTGRHVQEVVDTIAPPKRRTSANPPEMTTNVSSHRPDCDARADCQPSPGGMTTNVAAAPVGQSRVNGVLTEDPPDIAAKRASGRIPEGVVVEIEGPEDGVVTSERVREAGDDDEPVPDDAELDDEAWLETLPARGKIHSSLRRRFDADAMLYRALELHRKGFQYHAVRALNEARRHGGTGGAYGYHLTRFLKVDHPKHWLVCPTVENGGCAGTGEVPLIGQCAKCHGRGYWIN